MTRCQSCQGTYDDVDSAGVGYAHVCPPETFLRIRTPDGAIVEVPAIAPVPGEIIETIARERPGHRDENPRGGVGPDRDQIKREGRGRVPV